MKAMKRWYEGILWLLTVGRNRGIYGTSAPKTKTLIELK